MRAVRSSISKVCRRKVIACVSVCVCGVWSLARVYVMVIFGILFRLQEVELLDIMSIRDTRTGRYARTPKVGTTSANIAE